MKIGVLVVTLSFCLFMGITAVSMGLGAVIPAINRIAKPFVCPNGEMTTETQNYRVHPGKNVMSRTWYCVDAQTQTPTRLGLFPMVLYSGCVYGAGLFVFLVLIGLTIKPKRA